MNVIKNCARKKNERFECFKSFNCPNAKCTSHIYVFNLLPLKNVTISLEQEHINIM